MFLTDVLSSFAKLAFGIVFLFDGFTLGSFKMSGCISSYDQNPKKFVFDFARGISFGFFVYSTPMLIIGIVYGYYDVFILAICSCILGSSIAICGRASQDWKDWSVALLVAGVILTIKLAHTAYYTINLVLINDTDSGRYKYMVTSLVFECILLLVWSLWPFLSIRSTEQNVPLTVWSLELTDIISHLVVCLVYADSIAPLDNFGDSQILQAYFAFWLINLYLWALPLFPLIHSIIKQDGNGQSKDYLGYHISLVDVLTDLPMLIITACGRTYLNNYFIAVDIAVKIILFFRGAVWIPSVVCGRKHQIEVLTDWQFSKTEMETMQLVVDETTEARNQLQASVYLMISQLDAETQVGGAQIPADDIEMLRHACDGVIKWIAANQSVGKEEYIAKTAQFDDVVKPLLARHLNQHMH